MQGSKHLGAAGIALVQQLGGKAFSTVVGRYPKQISEQIAPGLASTSMRFRELVQESVDRGSYIAALWRRLEALWSAWQGRSSELPDDMMIVGPGTKAQTAMLERALASALAHATNWKLSPAELDHLHASCLTQTCRDIADAKMSLNL